MSLQHKSASIQTDKSGAKLISVPPGNHRVEVVFTNTPVRNVGSVLSLMAIVMICGLFGFDRLRHSC